jgi:hypothetical protein
MVVQCCKRLSFYVYTLPLYTRVSGSSASDSSDCSFIPSVLMSHRVLFPGRLRHRTTRFRFRIQSEHHITHQRLDKGSLEPDSDKSTATAAPISSFLPKRLLFFLIILRQFVSRTRLFLLSSLDYCNGRFITKQNEDLRWSLGRGGLGGDCWGITGMVFRYSISNSIIINHILIDHDIVHVVHDGGKWRRGRKHFEQIQSVRKESKNNICFHNQ